MKATLIGLAAALVLAGCGPGRGVDPSQYAGLPPQDTLAGGLAPAPSTATGGFAATPANPEQPASLGGNATTWESTPPAPAAGGTPAGGAPTAASATPAPAGARR